MSHGRSWQEHKAGRLKAEGEEDEGNYFFVLIFGLRPFIFNLSFAGRAGTSGAIVLKQKVGARPLGMGEAFVAGALHWNPAGLSQIRKHEISAIYLKGLTDTWFGSIGYAHPLKSGGKLTAKVRRRTRTPPKVLGTGKH